MCTPSMRIGFVYAEGRLHRLNQIMIDPKSVPTDFFYGAVQLKEQGHDVLYDEIDEQAGPKILRWIDHQWGLRFPVRFSLTHFFLSLSHLKKWNGCECVIATNSMAGMSLGLLKKLGWLRPPLASIHCGMVNYRQSRWRRKITAPLLKEQEIILFADAERTEIEKVFSIPADHFHICDAGMDIHFWNESDKDGDFVFCLGNDARRDFDTFVHAASLNSFPHKTLTRREIKIPIPDNLERLRGSWSEAAFSDEELRNLYHDCRCVVIPLVDSYQPSGQSVAQQAMSCGRPVIMTRTKGYWLHPDFKDGEHILLVPPENPEILAEKIRFLTDNPEEARKIGKAGREMLLKHYSVHHFARDIEQTCRMAISRI